MGEKDTAVTSIRIPVELKEQLERAAKEDRRSLNNKIILILEKWVKENTKE